MSMYECDIAESLKNTYYDQGYFIATKEIFLVSG